MLPVPLEEAWSEVLDRVARTCLGPHDRTGAALVSEVIHLSELYTRDRSAIRGSMGARAARLRFFVPRDLPKVEGPLLGIARALPRKATLTVTDLGAGYGTTSLGLARFAKRVGLCERLVVHAIDDDEAALEAFERLAVEAARAGLIVPIELRTTRGNVGVADPSGLVRDADLVLAGFVMNELFVEGSRDEGHRLELLVRWVERIRGAGVTILLEPALRGTSRTLQAVRDVVRERVLFPCVHRAPCPLLERERDWCHAELPLALPAFLAPVAKAAGLRFEGLSYAALVLGDAAPPSASGTIVGGPVASKGKVELHLCHAEGLTRVDWLARDGEPGVALHRGSLVKSDRPVGGERMRAVRDLMLAPMDD